MKDRLSELEEKIGTLSELEDKIETLEAENENLKQEILNIDKLELPLGTVIAWTPKPTKSTTNTSSIPDCWVLCDGTNIQNGQWAGETTPNLNGEKRSVYSHLLGLGITSKIILIF